MEGRLKRGQSQNRPLCYVPYVTLSVMTFPAIIYATQSPISGFAALVVGVVSAWLGANLFKVAVSCCGTVFILELILPCAVCSLRLSGTKENE